MPSCPSATAARGASYVDGALIGEALAWGCAAIAITLGRQDAAGRSSLEADMDLPARRSENRRLPRGSRPS